MPEQYKIWQKNIAKNYILYRKIRFFHTNKEVYCRILFFLCNFVRYYLVENITNFLYNLFINKGVNFMEKELYETRKTTTQKGEEMLLHYHLLREDMTEEGDNKTAVYGVQVSEFIGGELQDMEYVDGITDCKDKILNILQTLVHGLVTPVTLVNILDDMIE